MRNLLLVLAALVAAVLCCHKTEEPTPQTVTAPMQQSPGAGIVMVYDLTQSDTCLKPDVQTTSALLMKHAFSGVCLTGIHILPNSQQQQAWLSPFIHADTTALPSNFILAAKQSKINKEVILKVRQECDSVARMACDRIFLPQVYKWSDVTGALRLAAMAAQGYADKGLHPIVIVVSDMLQDLEPGPGIEPIPALNFPPDTEVIVIGAAPSVALKAIFGNVKIRALPAYQFLTL